MFLVVVIYSGCPFRCVVIMSDKEGVKSLEGETLNRSSSNEATKQSQKTPRKVAVQEGRE